MKSCTSRKLVRYPVWLRAESPLCLAASLTAWTKLCLCRVAHSCLLFFFFPERRYSRSRSKAGGLSYSSHLVGSRQPSEMALTPLTEQEGEAYLEKCGSIRRHTVANAHSDIQLLAMASMMHTGMVIEESDSNDKCLLLQPSFSHRQCSSEPSIADGPEGGMATGRQDSAELNCTSVS